MTMHAIRVNRPGGAEVLEWTALDVPKPGTGEVLIRVAAAGVNFIDVYHRKGLYPLEHPFTLGVEGAGVVEELGADVSGLEEGSRVAWSGSLGSYAEYKVIAADDVIEVPEGVEMEVAAAAMLQGLTAHYLCFDTFPLSQGDVCLIHAGAGGVGHLLVQIAKRLGAVVFATVGTEEKAEVARRAGADHVIDYRRHDFKDAVEEIAGPKALSVVYDGVGADTLEGSMELLRRRGMMVTYGNASGPPPPVDPLQLMRLGSIFLTRPTLADYVTNREELERRSSDLFTWIGRGELDVHIGARFPMAEAAEAHRALQARRTIGKVLLEA